MIRGTRAVRAIRPLIRPQLSKRFFGAGSHETYCGYTHPRRKQYHVFGYNYEQGGPLIQKTPTGLAGFGENVNCNICPPGLGKEGKWDYDTLVAISASWLGFHLIWWLLTLLPGGPTVMYDFAQVKGRHPNNME